MLPAGIATVFRHFAYPDRVRIKLSQLFVLPPHRGKGIAAALVRAAIKAAEDDPEVVDFTVEDPVPVVSRIRDVHGERGVGWGGYGVEDTREMCMVSEGRGGKCLGRL